VTSPLVGLTSYTTPAHVVSATLEANVFQMHAAIESMKLDSKSKLTHLKVDGGHDERDLAMEVPMDVCGFEVVRPEMRKSKCNEQSVRLPVLRLLSFSPYRAPYFSYAHWCVCSGFLSPLCPDGSTATTTWIMSLPPSRPISVAPSRMASI
jgi:hypothetical protein